MASKVARYVDLPSGMRKNNVKLLGRVMADSDRGRFAHIAYAQAVSDLSACLHTGVPVNLFATGFAITDRNMTSTEVAGLAKRAEVKELWPQVGRDSALTLHLGINTPSQLSVEVAKRKLDGFMEYRNQIAHRGPNYQVASPTVVKDYAEYFRALVPAVAQVLEDHLAAFP